MTPNFFFTFVVCWFDNEERGNKGRPPVVGSFSVVWNSHCTRHNESLPGDLLYHVLEVRTSTKRNLYFEYPTLHFVSMKLHLESLWKGLSDSGSLLIIIPKIGVLFDPTVSGTSERPIVGDTKRRRTDPFGHSTVSSYKFNWRSTRSTIQSN